MEIPMWVTYSITLFATLLARAGTACLLLAALIFHSPVQSQEQNVQPVTKSEIEAVAKRRIVFGHQSVGENILDGMRALAKEAGVSLNIVEAREADGANPGILHFKVGRNGDPLAKINDFATVVSDARFAKTDAAMVKLCYVDFNQGSDAVAIAKAYTAAIRKLQGTHPNTRFVAVTSPLTTVRSGPKEWAKRMLGRASTDAARNAKRKEFNDYLRQQFGQSHLFDIAEVETGPSSPDGAEALRPDLTDDGGHLNAKGQRLAAAALFKLLSAKE